MSTQQVRDIEQYFPTAPWLDEYRVALEDDESLSETGEGWGTDFQGAFIFQIENVPLDSHTGRDLPEEIVEAVEERIRSMDESELESIVERAPESIREDVEAREGDVHDRVLAEVLETPLSESPDRVWDELEAELPELMQQLLTQLEENVVDGDTVYAYLDVYDGGCREVDVVGSLEEREYGFRIIGDYPEWKKLVDGEGGVINMLMSGELDVDGDMQKILQYSDAAVDLADVAGGVDSRFVV